MAWHEKRSTHGCGGNRTESKTQHISRTSLETQRYCDEADKRNGTGAHRRRARSAPVPSDFGRDTGPRSRYY